MFVFALTYEEGGDLVRLATQALKSSVLHTASPSRIAMTKIIPLVD